MYFLFQVSQHPTERTPGRGQSTACNHPHHGHNSGVVPVGPRRRGEPEADNKATQAVNPNQTRRKYSCLKCHCQNFYKIKEKKGPTHSPRPASPQKQILHPKFYTQNTHKYTKTFQHSPPPTRNNPTPSDRQTFTKPYRQ